MKTLGSRIFGALAIFFAALFVFGVQSWGAPVFTAPPARNQIVEKKASVTFSVAAERSGALSYPGLRNGLPIADANGSTLPLGSVRYSDRCFYQVKVADSHSLALKSDVTVAVWGDNSQGAADVPARVIAIDAGQHVSLALRKLLSRSSRFSRSQLPRL